MESCTFCSNQSQMNFTHPNYDIGTLCIDCYMKFHGACGSCGKNFLPRVVKPNVNYSIQAKFIGMGEENYLVCVDCYNVFRKEFSQYFA